MSTDTPIKNTAITATDSVKARKEIKALNEEATAYRESIAALLDYIQNGPKA